MRTKIGLLGFGTVGGGTYDIITNENFEYSDRIIVNKIIAKHEIDSGRHLQVDNFEEIVTDGEITLIIEVMGGLEPAYTIVKDALLAGKNVISANKLMLSHHLPELLSISGKNGCTLAFSAAVGGGIPWLVNLIRLCRVDKVSRISGIMNGTTNYILSKMYKEGADFDRALAQAQALGYAEADPTADIDGLDVQSKLSLSMTIATARHLRASDIPAHGIRSISKIDIKNLSEIGLVCKLMGQGFIGNFVTAFVHPVAISAQSRAASVNGSGNILSVWGDLIGEQNFVGEGAGRTTTSAAVVQDIIDINDDNSPFTGMTLTDGAINSIHLHAAKFYLRTSAKVKSEFIEKHLGGGAYLLSQINLTEFYELYKEIKQQDSSSFFAELLQSEN